MQSIETHTKLLSKLKVDLQTTLAEIRELQNYLERAVQPNTNDQDIANILLNYLPNSQKLSCAGNKIENLRHMHQFTQYYQEIFREPLMSIEYKLTTIITEMAVSEKLHARLLEAQILINSIVNSTDQKLAELNQ